MIPAWKISLPLTCLTALINGEGCTENKALKPYPSQPRAGLDQPAGPRGCGGKGGECRGAKGQSVYARGISSAFVGAVRP